MPNMSYCRFENTFNDLLDCLRNITEETNSRDEMYRKRMLDLLITMVDNCSNESDLMDYLENQYF
jgi:hypothetical protein